MKPSLPRRSFLLRSIQIAVAGVLGRHGFAAAPATAGPTAPRAYPIQLHLHAHSSHALPGIANARPGNLPSMAWTSGLLADAGLDMLWWSEHDNSFRHTAAPGVFIRPTSDRTFAPLILPLVIGGEGEPSLELVPLTTSTAFDIAPLKPYSGRAYPPLYAEPEITLRFKSDNLSATTPIKVTLVLCWHDPASPARHRIEVRIGGIDSPATQVGPGLTLQKLAAPPADESGIREVVIKVGGEGYPADPDNVIGSVEITPRGSSLELVDATIICRRGAAHQMLSSRTQLARNNSERFGTHEFISAEYAGPAGEFSDPQRRADGQTHFNAYLPVGALVRQERLRGEILARRVHLLGGLLALNHPFGAGNYPGRLTDDSPERARALAGYLLATARNAFGVDLFEAGYFPGRGGKHFPGFLLAWDMLVANRRFLNPQRTIGAVGVSDDHGAPSVTGAYTWLLPSEGQTGPPDQATALEQLRTRRMFFGRPAIANFPQGLPPNAYFDFVVGDLKMGEEGDPGLYPPEATPISVTPRANLELLGSLFLSEIVLVQGGNVDVTLDPVRMPLPETVDTTVSKAFRVELWAEGQPVAFTNHIVVLRQPGELPTSRQGAAFDQAAARQHLVFPSE